MLQSMTSINRGMKFLRCGLPALFHNQDTLLRERSYRQCGNMFGRVVERRVFGPTLRALRTDVATLFHTKCDGAASALSTDVHSAMGDLTDVLGAIGALRTEFGALRTDVAATEKLGSPVEFVSSGVIDKQFGASLGASCALRSADEVAVPPVRGVPPGARHRA